MRNNIKYIATALILVLAASCNKIDERISGENLIRFAPQTIGTKATVEENADLQAQTFGVGGFGAVTFQNTISYSGGIWEYGTEAKYMWGSGEHSFYGYTADAESSLANNKLTISNKVLTTADDKTSDLLFSEVFTTTAADWKEHHAMTDCIPLHFHHMLSAVSITIKNCTDNDVTVTKVSAPSIPNSGTVEIDFTSADENGIPTVEYSDIVVDGAFVTATPISSDTELASAEMIDVLTMAKADEGSYQVIWPQTLGEGDNAVKITVSYIMNGTEYNDKVVPIPADTWEAGKKYDYVLQILPTEVRLVFIVQPWEGEEFDIDSSNGSINMSNVNWQNSTVRFTADGEEVNTLSIGNYSVYMYKDVYAKEIDELGQESWVLKEGYFPAQGYFTVNYPLSGKFKIDFKQAAYWDDPVPEGVYSIYIYDSSTKSWKAQSEDGEDIPEDHDTIYFQVRASADLGTHPEYRAQIDIWFMPDGSEEWISAYSEIRANYACVIASE